MTTEAQARATAKYDKANTRQVMLKLNINTDADILERLDAQDNRQGYIKHLIRQDIEANPMRCFVYIERYPSGDEYEHPLRARTLPEAIDEGASYFNGMTDKERDKLEAACIVDIEGAEDFCTWLELHAEGFDPVHEFK